MGNNGKGVKSRRERVGGRAFYSRGNEADCPMNEPGEENPALSLYVKLWPNR